MPVYQLPEQYIFPPAELAEANGLIGYGGDLAPERLILGYQRGIFPWYSEGQPILWFSPDPRYVLDPKEFRIQRSLKKRIKQEPFDIRINTAFEQVLEQCSSIPRPNQYGTWITTAMKEAYLELHRQGYAYSFEAWQNDRLVGGLYGIMQTGVFCGESMFHHQTNCSKLAMWALVNWLKRHNAHFIDCQLENPYLTTLGAKLIPRSEFLTRLNTAQSYEIPNSMWAPQVLEYIYD